VDPSNKLKYILNNYILLTSKPWHDDLFDQLARREDETWLRILQKEDVFLDKLLSYNPSKIFIPHWSYILPKKIWQSFECIVFHMTDLPYGRGGSPLQNLIVRGHKDTMISALRVEKGIDTGPIYLKKPLSLEGTAEEIFIRSSKIIETMIQQIIDDKITPKKQSGEPVVFKRRKPQDGLMNGLQELTDVYDYIRMLDADGYPSAYFETEYFKIEVTKASLDNQEQIEANVRISKK
jgi:methionyl-tRNA formyltransferase